jgi:5-methylcytosine-specific restriction endonuclease McrA
MLQKLKRIKDQKCIDKIRKIGYCEICGSNYALEVHHIKSKGSGGNDTEDNLICLCYVHHRETHDGNISRDKLREIVRNRNG